MVGLLNTLYVAAIGNIWGKDGDRGFFKTIDGGKTWTKLSNNLPSDGWTGNLTAFSSRASMSGELARRRFSKAGV